MYAKAINMHNMAYVFLSANLCSSCTQISERLRDQVFAATAVILISVVITDPAQDFYCCECHAASGEVNIGMHPVTHQLTSISLRGRLCP